MHPFETKSKMLTKEETVSGCNKTDAGGLEFIYEVKTLFPVSPA